MISIGVLGFLKPANKPKAIPQSFVFGATKLGLSGNNVFILEANNMLRPQPPVIMMGRSSYFFK